MKKEGAKNNKRIEGSGPRRRGEPAVDRVGYRRPVLHLVDLFMGQVRRVSLFEFIIHGLALI